MLNTRLQLRTRLVAVSILTIFVLAVSLPFETVPRARATPGHAVDNPSNIWSPYGPFVKNLILQYYDNSASEFTDFVAGKLDITDSTQPRASLGGYDDNPDFTLSPVQGAFDLFGIYFNGTSSTWINWGCNWSGSTGHLYDSACSIQMRQAFAHLVNRGDFAHNNVANPAVGLADDIPPAKGEATATPFATQCTWDASVMVAFGTSCYNHWGGNEPGGYTITGSGTTCTPTTAGSGPVQLYQNCNAGTGFPAVGSPDFCAAAIHMLSADVATGMTSSCVLTGVNPGVFAHPFRMMTRNVDPRLTLGEEFSKELDALFGGTVVTETTGGIEIGPIVFLDQSELVDDWDGYTYGYGETGPFGGDLLFSLYSSQFTSVNGPCSGAASKLEPSNPTFVCDATTDAVLQDQASSPDLWTFTHRTLVAMNRLGQLANDLPVYSPGIRIAALTSVAGLVNSRGFGYNSAIDLLNARPDFGYSPVNTIYAFGRGDPTTIRYGQSSPTAQLNIFNAQTPQEFQTIGEIYDTLFAANPVQPTNVFCWMCNSYVISVDTSGNTHFRVELRQNLRWQDEGQCDTSVLTSCGLVTPKDVAFSLLALRDLSPFGAGERLNALLNVNVLNNSTLNVTFEGQSMRYPSDLEAFIVPRHIWECDLVFENDCAASSISSAEYTAAGVNVPSPARVSYDFDPVSRNVLVGSGPFMCKGFNPFSINFVVIGGGCVTNSDGSSGGQAISAGGRMTLTLFDRTYETLLASGAYSITTDPFLQYMRSFDINWGTSGSCPQVNQALASLYQPQTCEHSGQYQEFAWADMDKDGEVLLPDLASAAACFGSSSYGLGPACTPAAYDYWHRTAFEFNPVGIIDSILVTTVAAHYGDTYVSPYSWSSSSLENIVPSP